MCKNTKNKDWEGKNNENFSQKMRNRNLNKSLIVGVDEMACRII